MKTLSLILALMWMVPMAYSQDQVYATSFSNDGKIMQITANPVTGVVSGNFTDLTSVIQSAALGIDSNGWLYFLQYGSNGTGEGNGRVDIYVARASGQPISGNTYYKRIANNFDVNGASNNEIGFVRLGVDATGTAWILAKDNQHKIHLAKFQCNGSSDVTPSVVTSNLSTSDGDNSVFENGDVAFDGNGGMYALANDGNGKTKIYSLVPSSVAVNGTATLNLKWTLKQTSVNGLVNFSGRVNGAAFSSTGSMYISTDAGLYFIDQNSVNFAGQGTVECRLVKSQSSLTDLATPYWPAHTQLPIRFKSISAKVVQKGVVDLTFEVEEASGVSHYNIQVSDDGKTYKTVMVVFPDNGKTEYTHKVRVKF